MPNYFKDGTELVITVPETKEPNSGIGDVNQGVAIFNSIGYMSGEDGHDLPMFKGVANAYKKAKQLLNIPWTALAAIPTDGSATGCAAGQHTGMLYSEALQFEKYVGYGCSLRTFMTAVHNPYSVMYTEDTKGTSARKKSAYGFDYLNTVLNGAFYGTVCTAFTCWAIGSPLIWQSYDHAWAAKQGLFVEVADNSATGVRLMDVLWKDGHCRIITDIVRGSDGMPTAIYVSESWQNFPRTLTYTAAQFNNLIRQKINDHFHFIYIININYRRSVSSVQTVVNKIGIVICKTVFCYFYTSVRAHLIISINQNV